MPKNEYKPMKSIDAQRLAQLKPDMVPVGERPMPVFTVGNDLPVVNISCDGATQIINLIDYGFCNDVLVRINNGQFEARYTQQYLGEVVLIFSEWFNLTFAQSGLSAQGYSDIENNIESGISIMNMSNNNDVRVEMISNSMGRIEQRLWQNDNGLMTNPTFMLNANRLSFCLAAVQLING